MSWYSAKATPPALDYSKPIVAKRPGYVYLLMPRLESRINFNIAGYDWFNIATGEFNSCVCYATPEAAVASYRGRYNITNATISVCAQ